MNRQQVWKAIGVVLLACGLQLYGHGAAKTATFILFEVPGSTCLTTFIQCTTVVAINPDGAVTGTYADANEASHSYLRASNGTFATFDPPGSTCCSYPAGINPAGAIAGTYCDAITCHGFLRSPDGRFTTFDPTGSVLTSVGQPRHQSGGGDHWVLP
jgi:hypothetical protein